MIIEESNLSVAWGKAFLEVFEANEVSPLLVVIKDIDGGDPLELPSMREALDHALEAEGKGLCHAVANTIFPNGMWNPEAGREEFFERYLRILPRLRKYSGNRNGLYFERLISFGQKNGHGNEVNQLEHVIQTWNTGNHRRTALQASLFDPFKDHTHRRRLGFPCLQHVSFARSGKDGLAVTGVYVTQFMFERAYGNYLGLCRLGQFMAHEMGLKLDRMICIATPAKRDGSKSKLGPLARSIRASLEQIRPGGPLG